MNPDSFRSDPPGLPISSATGVPYLQENMECMIALFQRHTDHHRTAAAARDARNRRHGTRHQEPDGGVPSFKPAMLSNGVRTAVPPHIATGTRVVIANRRTAPMSRAAAKD